MKLLFSLLAFVLCGIPTWIWLTAYFVLNPEGFWQKLLLGFLGLYVLGILQLILIIIFFAMLVAIWDD